MDGLRTDAHMFIGSYSWFHAFLEHLTFLEQVKYMCLAKLYYLTWDTAQNMLKFCPVAELVLISANCNLSSFKRARPKCAQFLPSGFSPVLLWSSSRLYIFKIKG